MLNKIKRLARVEFDINNLVVVRRGSVFEYTMFEDIEIIIDDSIDTIESVNFNGLKHILRPKFYELHKIVRHLV